MPNVKDSEGRRSASVDAMRVAEQYAWDIWRLARETNAPLNSDTACRRIMLLIEKAAKVLQRRGDHEHKELKRRLSAKESLAYHHQKQARKLRKRCNERDREVKSLVSRLESERNRRVRAEKELDAIRSGDI